MKQPLPWLVACTAAGLVAGPVKFSLAAGQKTIPYVPTREDIVKDLLWIAGTSTNDVVYDLGSGDGRVVIAAARDFRVREAVGVEIREPLLRESRNQTAAAGVDGRIQWIHGDLFTNDFSRADVLVLYLGHSAHIDLRPRIFASLKPGARVVTHQFGMGEWRPDKRLIVRAEILGMYGEMSNEFRRNPDVPDFDPVESRANYHEVLSWVVPARVAGSWTGSVHLQGGSAELTIQLHQRLSTINGNFELKGATDASGSVRADLWGDHLRLWCIPKGQDGFNSQFWFEGRVRGDNLTGDLWYAGKEARESVSWTGSRKHFEYTGTWEWPGLSNAPVQLKIERADGRYVATYSELQGAAGAPARTAAVNDFYDFGGGFYFTLLLGLDGSMTQGQRRMGPGDGWVVGEAIVVDGELLGSIAYYPYSGTPGIRPAVDAGAPRTWKDWRPKRVAR